MTEDQAVQLAREFLTQKGYEWKGVEQKKIHKLYFLFGAKNYSFTMNTDGGMVFVNVAEDEGRVTHFGPLNGHA